MLIAHIQTPWGESYFHIGDTPADIFARLSEALGHDGMVGMFCTDDNWEGAALTLGNIEQIEVAKTGHWRTSVGDKVSICKYPDKTKPIDRIESLRGAVSVAEAHDKLLHEIDFSGLEMDTIRKNWKGFTFAECNLSGAEFTGCEMGNNEFIECNLAKCWMPMSESTNIVIRENCTFGA